jgi:hypothetical protein
MIKNQRASSYAELNAFIQNHKASIGRYLVEHDETNLGNPIEYYYKVQLSLLYQDLQKEVLLVEDFLQS